VPSKGNSHLRIRVEPTLKQYVRGYAVSNETRRCNFLLSVPVKLVPHQLKIVFSTIERLFDITRRTIGRTIIRNLYKNLGPRFAENPSYHLCGYVEDALF